MRSVRGGVEVDAERGLIDLVEYGNAEGTRLQRDRRSEVITSWKSRRPCEEKGVGHRSFWRGTGERRRGVVKIPWDWLATSRIALGPTTHVKGPFGQREAYCATASTNYSK